MTMRINLLPSEILERRRFERQFRYVVLGGILATVSVSAVYVGLMLHVADERRALQDRQQHVAELQQQADAFRIFEEKESALRARQEAAAIALADRVSWGRLANEISLVLPAEVWLAELSGSETDGLTVIAWTADTPDDVPDTGHIAVARTLIRLADLEQLESAWLMNSEKVTFLEQPAVQFVISAGVTKIEPTMSQEASVPAPPPTAP